MSRNRFGLWGLAGGLVVVVCWMFSPAVAEAKGKKKDNKEQHVRGKVVAVSADKTGTGSITIATPAKKGKNGAAAGKGKKAAETKTFQIGPNTVFEAVTAAGKTPVTLAALHRGEQVTISATNGPADEVDIAVAKKAKKGKKAKKAIA